MIHRPPAGTLSPPALKSYDESVVITIISAVIVLIENTAYNYSSLWRHEDDVAGVELSL